MAIAAGAKTEKMKFGHRGVNQPAVNTITGQVVISSQNHGFAVDIATIPDGWAPLYVNANDGSCEGIICHDKPFFSVQFHPEACAGPLDSDSLFDHFIMVSALQKKHLEETGGKEHKWWFQKTGEPWLE